MSDRPGGRGGDAPTRFSERDGHGEVETTRIGGGRSAAAIAVAFIVLLAGGWLALALNQPRGEDRLATSPVVTPAASADVAAAPRPTVAPASPTPAPTAAPRHTPPASASPPTGDSLALLVDLDDNRYWVPLRKTASGTFHGWANLVYPFTARTASVMLLTLEESRDQEPHALRTWRARLNPGGGADRPVSLLEFGERARPRLRDMPGLLRFGFLVTIAVDGGHYPRLSARLTSPYGLRLSGAGACEGGWARPEERC
ncbi:MAG: hypothetical protein M3N29_06745 [Chloroflexota bacterium]|nr:hypothetical protein [Chloroflexota bacterium]